MNAKATFEHLCENIPSQLEETQVPGVAIGIFCKNRMYTNGFGVTSIKHSLPVDDNTRFQIGSISKTVVGTAVMRLVEQGKLDLDATVRTYLPDFAVAEKAASEQVTLRHLLTHTAGWEGDFFHDTGPGDDALTRYVADMADLEQLAPIGTVFSYNNAGFVLLGHILETVEKKPVQDILKSRVLNPLYMTSACFHPNDVMTHRFGVGHSMGKKGPEIAQPWALPRYAWAAGGVICHVKDLIKYGRFHLGDGRAGKRRLLTRKSMNQMHTEQVAIGQLQDAVGLTWFIDHINDVTLLSHGGSTVGQNAHLLLVPKHRFALAILTNSGRGSALISRIKRQALADYLNLEAPEPASIKSTARDLKPYAGRYVRPPAEIRIQYKKGYDGKVDWTDTSRMQYVGCHNGVTLYTAVLNHIHFKRNLRVLLLISQHHKDTPQRVILFSTDVDLDAWKIYRYYRIRFQIEFIFRDAKQFTGLEDCQARDQDRLDFHFNASLTALNVAKAEILNAQDTSIRTRCSLASIKAEYFNRHYLERIIRIFDLDLSWIKNHPQYRNLTTYGNIAA